MELVKPHERVDDLLVNGLKIIQNPNAFCFGCDAVEIANFVSGGAKDYAVDLGSGTGIITILLAGKKGIRTTGVEIQPATMAKIADIPNIAGIKDAGGNMSKTMETFRLVREKCDVYSGEDALNLPILMCGGAGVISVLSNVVPKDVKKLGTLVQEGKYEEARALNDKLLPLASACFVEVNPIPVKEAMNILGFNAGTPRAPLTTIEDANREKLLCAMKNYGLECKA